VTTQSPDPFADIPEGRLVFATDDDNVGFDIEHYRRRLNLAERACVPLLGIAAAAALWQGIAFLQRGADDITITPGKPTGYGFTTDPTADYTHDFFVRSQGPFIVALLLCAVGFMWWQLTVDRVARKCGDPMDGKRWQPIWGWLVPIGNFWLPFRSVRELSEVHGADRAQQIVKPWWGLWVVPQVVNIFAINAANSSSPLAMSDGPTAEDLGHLDKYSAFVGFCTAGDAVLAIVLVLSLSAAVRWRLTPDEE
jgi:hypothetical protein